MSATAPATSPSAAPTAHVTGMNSPARAIRLGVLRIGYEVRSYFRQLDTVFFTFLFPLLLLVIFSAAFSRITVPNGTGGTEDMPGAQYYLPAMLAAGVLLSGVQNLGVDIAMERSDGTLKRLAGTPLPVVSYFIGKIGQALVTGIAQAAVLILVGWLAFGVPLPTDPAAWLTFAWVFLLGIATCAVLGIALSRVPRSGRSATAVIIPIVLVLQFISGVYLPFSQLPEWLQNIAAVFPLKWMAQGMRAVLLPDDMRMAEVGQEWNLHWVAIVLGIWLVAGLILTRLTFRWIRRV